MPTPSHNRIATAPNWLLHRDAVTAADAVSFLAAKANGVKCEFAEVVANLKVVGPAGGATFEILFWSDVCGKFISASTPITYTVTAVAAPGCGAKAISFVTNGRTFILAVTAIDANCVADAEVAGYWLDPRYD